MTQKWLQIRGDPSIRKFLFDQSKITNEFDLQIDSVLEKSRHLLTEHGVFHSKVHFSSGQVTLWLLYKPYSYQIVLKEDFLNENFCNNLPKIPYPENAKIPAESIHDIFQIFKKLRMTDDTVYLRSASINIMNGCIGLNFSCDGSHYLDYQDFLAKAHSTYDM